MYKVIAQLRIRTDTLNDFGEKRVVEIDHIYECLNTVRSWEIPDDETRIPKGLIAIKDGQLVFWDGEKWIYLVDLKPGMGVTNGRDDRPLTTDDIATELGEAGKIGAYSVWDSKIALPMNIAGDSGSIAGYPIGITDLQDGDGIFFNAVLGKWVNAPKGAVGGGANLALFDHGELLLTYNGDNTAELDLEFNEVVDECQAVIGDVLEIVGGGAVEIAAMADQLLVDAASALDGFGADISNAIARHNTDELSHEDLRRTIDGWAAPLDDIATRLAEINTILPSLVTLVNSIVFDPPAQSVALTYNGKAQTVSWRGYNSAKMTMGGTTSATNAGTYATTFTLAAGYFWYGGGTGKITVNWTIGKAAQTLTLSATTVAAYVGNPVVVTAITDSDGSLSATSSNTAYATAGVSGRQIQITGLRTGSATITAKLAEGTNHKEASATCRVNVSIYPYTEVLYTSSARNVVFPEGITRLRVAVCGGGGGAASATYVGVHVDITGGTGGDSSLATSSGKVLIKATGGGGGRIYYYTLGSYSEDIHAGAGGTPGGRAGSVAYNKNGASGGRGYGPTITGAHTSGPYYGQGGYVPSVSYDAHDVSCGGGSGGQTNAWVDITSGERLSVTVGGGGALAGDQHLDPILYRAVGGTGGYVLITYGGA